MKSLTIYDKIAIPIAQFITSTLFVIVVMITFMGGIVWHLEHVFNSMFLAIGFQCVVLISSVNADILPKTKIGEKYNIVTKKYEVKTLPTIALIMSIFMLFFISISFGLVKFGKSGDWLNFTIVLVKSISIASMELMFSFLFNTRWNTDLIRYATKPEIVDKTDLTTEKLNEIDKQVDEILKSDSIQNVVPVIKHVPFEQNITESSAEITGVNIIHNEAKSSGSYL